MKLILRKWHDYRSDLNFVAGQAAQDGTVLLIETDQRELDFFESRLLCGAHICMHAARMEYI
ncbi:hypothetical protein ACQCVH_08120 [Bacillus infantis]|uniref:hypothetical protein n=1 Tax=Bacillus infantis TaxID=324767 RepID=UPI003CF1733F